MVTRNLQEGVFKPNRHGCSRDMQCMVNATLVRQF